MANPFSINVITSAGAALIAQATSSNQIVMVGALSGTVAASDAADLASKTEAFYDGASGSISSSSATDNVARVVTRFANATANSQIVKSVALKAKLANQTDAQAVIIAAMSDSNSQITIPPNTSPNQIIRIPFLLTINATGTVSTQYADGATIADLERFVSMYKAGDPTQGEAQNVKGKKTFVDDAAFGGDVDITYDLATMGKATFFSQIEAQDDVDVSGTLDAGSITTNTITTRNSGDDDLTINCGDLKTSGITLSGSLDVADDSTFRGYVEVFGELNVSKVVGLAPKYTSGTISLPIGGIALAIIPVSASVECGDLITANSDVYSATYDKNSNSFGSSTKLLPNGTYRLLHGVTYESPTTNYPCLVIRVS